MTHDEEVRVALQSLRGAFTPVGDIASDVERAALSRQRRRKARGISIVAATALAVIGLTAVGPMDLGTHGVQPASSPTGNSSDADATGQDESAWQLAISGYQHDLLAAAEAHDNFTGASLDFATRELRVYGTDQPAADVAALMDDAPVSVNAVWVTVPYSKRELEDAASEVVAVTPNAVYSHPSADYSSIVVGVDGLSGSDRHLTRKAAEVTDVPVTFENSSPAVVGPGQVDCSTVTYC